MRGAWGVPNDWGPSRLEGFLKEQSWDSERLLDGRGRFSPWKLLAKCPKQAVFEFQIGSAESECFLTIAPWKSSRRPEKFPTRVSGSRWTASGEIKEPDEAPFTASPSPTVPATRLDADDEDEDEVLDTTMDDAPHPKREAEKLSPEAKRGKANTGAKQPKPKEDNPNRETPVKDGDIGPQGFGRVLDLGGCGDCGWRSLAWMIGSHEPKEGGKPFNRASLLNNIEKISECLRLKTVSFLLRRDTEAGPLDTSSWLGRGH